MNIKFQEKIFTTKKVIKLWNFGNFGIPKIIPKSLVTLRFSKISLQELKGICKCIQMRYWPNFYVDPTYSNTCFFKVGKWRVLLQGTVYSNCKKIETLLSGLYVLKNWLFFRVIYLKSSFYCLIIKIFQKALNQK